LVNDPLQNSKVICQFFFGIKFSLYYFDSYF
jgi:hypothetical protein